MNSLLKFGKSLSIAVLLIGISGNFCFAQTQKPRGRSLALYPNRYKCTDLSELEKIKVDPQDDTITSTDYQLASDYRAVSGWLQGYFTAWNFNKDTDGNVTNGATTYQVMTWIFSYCRTHPLDNLERVAFEFMDGMMRSTQKDR